MTDQEIWDEDTPITDLDVDIEVPSWIEQDISPQDVAAIVQGGCSSGAYMPAVTYHQALATMDEYGDDILDYIDNIYGEIPEPVDKGISWSARASYYVSIAVQSWSLSAHDELKYSNEVSQDTPGGLEHSSAVGIEHFNS